MTMFTFQRIHIEYVLLFVIFSSLILHQGCSKPPQTVLFENLSTAPADDSSSACINVNGKVLGDIIPHSIVSLYKTPGLNYSTVMSTIRTTQPVMQELVNESAGFEFDCLSFGKYVFVIPTTSYNGAVGSPLPYEFDCQNISLGIAFQGGDSAYSVGAFSIINSSGKNHSACIENSIYCQNKKGGLYKKCPFDRK